MSEHPLSRRVTVGWNKIEMSTYEWAGTSPDTGVIVNGPRKSHSNIVSNSLRFLMRTCLVKYSPAAHGPMSSSLASSILNCGSAAVSGILRVFWKSSRFTSRQSSYLSFSSGRNVMGKVNVVPGLSEIIFGWSVVKKRVLGTLFMRNANGLLK